MKIEKLNKTIDHTLLKPEASVQQINKVCDEALEFDFASVCVNPFWVKHVSSRLADSDVKVCTVIGFPLGANTIETKVYETENAIENGAEEIDMVLNISMLRDLEEVYLLDEISSVVKAAKGKKVKVIIETCLLDDEQKILACKIVKEAGASFIKTSTGFSTGGATKEDIELFNRELNGAFEIKASGGVRTLEDVEVMINAGATRIGTSGGVNIINGLQNNESY